MDSRIRQTFTASPAEPGGLLAALARPFLVGTASWEKPLRAGGAAGLPRRIRPINKPPANFCFGCRLTDTLRVSASPKNQAYTRDFSAPPKKHPLACRAGPIRFCVPREKRGKKGEKP